MIYDGTRGDKSLKHESLRFLAWSQLQNYDPDYDEGGARLRRAISSAYYAVFHLLVYETCLFMFGRNGVGDKSLRDYASRVFSHAKVKAVCDRAKEGQTMAATVESVFPRLCKNAGSVAIVPSTLSRPYGLRVIADYELYTPLLKSTADDAVSDMNEAFDALAYAKENDRGGFDALMTVLMTAALREPYNEKDKAT